MHTHICKQCAGLCPKTCKGNVLDRIYQGVEFVGCEVIEGSLTFRITDEGEPHLQLQELIGMFSTVREVTGFIKVIRSKSLTSLKFLQNIQKVHGNELTDGVISWLF